MNINQPVEFSFKNEAEKAIKIAGIEIKIVLFIKYDSGSLDKKSINNKIKQ
jgi:hypothetical protein